ncbi:MAG: AAA family ATPase, partial [Armatimonadota bacterium]|nr:AAA family ATPase [Armatimonadota bacterium]
VLAAEIERIEALTGRRDAAQAELISARISLATVSEQTVSLDRSGRGLRAELEGIAAQAERKRQQAQAAHDEYATLVAQTEQRDREAERAVQNRAMAQAALDAQAHTRQELLQESYQANAEMRSLAEARATALEAIHKNELREARLGAQRDSLAARLRDDYEITVEAALALPEDPEVGEGTPQEVARLRRELRAIGDVNTGAVEEYQEIKTRYEFLTAQRADLEDASGKLLAAIKEIDEGTRGVFLETFQAVGQAFDGLFTRLFGGGKTELVLTQPHDILETGIDILVQPPGKKRQNLALLSGGERALTAAALLFAFLQVKPSPFCVLDEVDAPLDGANVERFADLLREFGARSQMIIITHNATTMEAAPVWYGVTMQQPGISRVLSMQVPVEAK